MSEIIKRIRIEKRISQYKLAELTGFSQSKIAKLETNKLNLKMVDCVTIAKALDVPVSYLLAE